MKILIASLSIIAFATAAFSSVPLGKVLAEGNAARSVEATNKLFDELVPLQRALLLKAIGVPLREIPLKALSEKKGFREAVMQSLLSDYSRITNPRPLQYKPEFIGAKEANPIYSTYLPATYDLSAEDVYFSFRKYSPIHGVGILTRFFLSDVESDLIFLLGNSGRRDILEKMNKLDAETIQELERKVSIAWVLWAQDTASNSETIQSFQEILGGDYKAIQEDIVQRSKSKHPAYTEEDKRLLEEGGKELLKEWDKIEAMDADSSERNKALGILSHNYAVYRISTAIKPSIEADVGRIGKVGQTLLDDLTIPTISAVDKLALILSIITTPNTPVIIKSEEKDFLSENFLNILDKELQQTLADKEQH